MSNATDDITWGETAESVAPSIRLLGVFLKNRDAVQNWIASGKPSPESFGPQKKIIAKAIFERWREHKVLMTREGFAAYIEKMSTKKKMGLMSLFTECSMYGGLTSADNIPTLVDSIMADERTALTLDIAHQLKGLPDGTVSPQKIIDVLKRIESNGTAIQLVSFADIQAKPINWLWPGRIALGTITVIAGLGGSSKSLLTTHLAAVVSKGGELPAGEGHAPIGDVVLLNAEDDAARTIKHRLEAAGADVRRIYDIGGGAGFSLGNVSMLANMLEQKPEAKLVIIDPIGAFMGDADSYKDSDVRALLAPLAELAEQRQVSIVLVAHLNKGGKGMAAASRVSGSIAVVNAARAAFLVAKDRDNEKRRLFLPMKNNLGNDSTGLAYSITGDEQRIRCEWEQSAVDITADEALSVSEEMGSEKLEQAKEWLTNMLAAGGRPSSEIVDLARANNITYSTIRRAKEELGVKADRDGFGDKGIWHWLLPNAPTAPKIASADDPWTT